MGRRVTLADVASAAGVSTATVSYVLNDRQGHSIPEGTRARVRDARVPYQSVERRPDTRARPQ